MAGLHFAVHTGKSEWNSVRMIINALIIDALSPGHGGVSAG